MPSARRVAFFLAGGALAAAVAVAVGCSVVIGIPDRGAATSDANGGEVLVDTSAETPSDTFVADSGRADLGADGATFCSSVGSPYFCDDFEKGDLSKWDAIVVDAGGEVAASSVYPAPPDQPGHSLLAAQAADAPAPTAAAVETTVPASAHVVVDFDIFLEAPVPPGGATLYFFRLQATNELRLFCVYDNCDLQESYPGGYRDHSFSITVASGKYFHVTVDLSLAVDKLAVSVSFEGVALLHDEPLAASWKPENSSVFFGLPVVQAHLYEQKVHVDNVVVTAG